MGIDHDLDAAMRKAAMAADLAVAPGTPFLLSLADRTKAEAVPLIHALHKAGCELLATEGTAALIRELGLPRHLRHQAALEGPPQRRRT